MCPGGGMRRLAALVVCILCWAFPALAQVAVDLNEDRPISLIADRVNFDPNTGVLIADGNVQIFRGQETLSTDRLIYDQKERRLTIPGPLVMTDGTDVVTRADGAVLDADLEGGLIEGAELLIARQLQLVADRVHQKDGKFKVLDKVVATGCHVCAQNPVPFWKIRARRVIHDEEARRLYFENATLDVLGVHRRSAPQERQALRFQNFLLR